MSSRTVGTIIHGAYGDCYEQICAIRLLKKKRNDRWLCFFAEKNRLEAFRQFDLSVFDAVFGAEDIENVHVDEFFQFQVLDKELNDNILSKLSFEILAKFDFKNNNLPWLFLRNHNYQSDPMYLELSPQGKEIYPDVIRRNEVDECLFENSFTVGYLWRYRKPGGAINPMLQRAAEWIVETKSALMNKLIKEKGAHVFVCGMNKTLITDPEEAVIKANSGVVAGEYKSKYSLETLDIPKEHCTYMRGLSYACEMEIMSKCDILLMMPSGFSEPLWMRTPRTVLMTDPPPSYLLKIFYRRMPWFNNRSLDCFVYNNLVPHTANNVYTFLKFKGLA